MPARAGQCPPLDEPPLLEVPPLPLPVEPPVPLPVLPPAEPRDPLFGFEPAVPDEAVVAVPEGLPLPVMEPEVPLVPVVDEPVEPPLVPVIEEPVEPPLGPVIEEPVEPPLVPVIEEPDEPPGPIIAPPAAVSVVVGALFDMPVELPPGEPLVGDDASLLSFPHPTATVAQSSATAILIFMIVLHVLKRRPCDSA